MDMAPEIECANLVDELTTPGAPGEKAAAHLAQCPDCRATRATVETLQQRGSMVAEATWRPMAQRISARLATRLAEAGAAGAAGSGAGGSAVGLPAVAGMLLVGALGATLTWFAATSRPSSGLPDAVRPAIVATATVPLTAAPISTGADATSGLASAAMAVPPSGTGVAAGTMLRTTPGDAGTGSVQRVAPADDDGAPGGAAGPGD